MIEDKRQVRVRPSASGSAGGSTGSPPLEPSRAESRGSGLHPQNEKHARVRFAPSPTGFLHIGSARTALFNWLYARNQAGKFILRIEDTDTERSKEDFLKEILESLKWLGMEPDEAIQFQSKRKSIYDSCAKRLLDESKAYYEETEKGKAVRFKNPKQKIIFDDAVKGKIEFDTNEFDDLVLIKSDGTPTYNFACVVDDIEMKITHIIRGDDHISNTPKQIMLYNALGIKPPKFAHIPLILGEDRSRMSKRHGATSIAEYRENGYLPEAVLNFLALLGWSPKDDREKLSVKEIIKLFSLKAIKNAPAVFDIKKLNWLNSEYIKSYPPEKTAGIFGQLLIKKGVLKQDYDKKWLTQVMKVFATRVSNIDELITKGSFLFKDKIDFDPAAIKEHINKETLSYIEKYKQIIETLENFNERELENQARKLSEELNIHWSKLIHPVRVAVTGSTASPGIFEVLVLLGKEKVLKRLEGIKTIKL